MLFRSTASLAASLAARDPRVLAGVLRAVREGADLTLAQGLLLEASLAATARAATEKTP